MLSVTDLFIFCITAGRRGMPMARLRIWLPTLSSSSLWQLPFLRFAPLRWKNLRCIYQVTGILILSYCPTPQPLSLDYHPMLNLVMCSYMTVALPREIIMYIFRWVVSRDLDMRALEQLSLVCRGFYICARSAPLTLYAIMFIKKTKLSTS